MAKSNPGGGGFTKRREVPVRSGPPRTNVISKDAVMHIGQMRQTHVTEQGDLKRPLYPLVERTAQQVRSGNDVAASTVCKPGGSRNIYPTGSQSQHGRPNPGSSPAAKDILSGYGNDMPSNSMLKR